MTIHICYSTKRKFDVNRGPAHTWPSCFPHDEIRVPEGWVSSLEINDRMVSFGFAFIAGARTVPRATHVVVIVKGSREQAVSDPSKWVNGQTHFILPSRVAIRPQQESGELLSVLDWLKTNALVSFTENQKNEWVAAGKLKFN